MKASVLFRPFSSSAKSVRLPVACRLTTPLFHSRWFTSGSAVVKPEPIESALDQPKKEYYGPDFTSFTKLGVASHIASKLAAKAITHPTLIQSLSIPLICQRFQVRC